MYVPGILIMKMGIRVTFLVLHLTMKLVHMGRQLPTYPSSGTLKTRKVENKNNLYIVEVLPFGTRKLKDLNGLMFLRLRGTDISVKVCLVKLIWENK
jgi:hypothetical protein